MNKKSTLRRLLRISDLDDPALELILNRAMHLHRTGSAAPEIAGRPFVLGSLFLTSSMRTRIGFAVAACRLGGASLPVGDLRFDEKMSGAESFDDALRVLTGMVDVLVVRAPFAVDSATVDRFAVAPVVNGGDTVEHPSQGLIDLAAIGAFAGQISGLDVAICGDLTMRSVRSDLELFARRPPRSLLLSAPPTRTLPTPEPLRSITAVVQPGDIRDVDVLLVPGLAPHVGDDHLSVDERRQYAVTPSMLDRLPDHCVILSPMPVIDEVGPAARADRRLRMYEESDLGVAVRMAILEWVLADG